MIKNLFIQNIALISKLNIEFNEGLIVMSGETGAGKSIIVDSLSFVLGERADKTLIKYGEDSAFVEVVFQISADSSTYGLLEELGFEPDTTVVINRTLNMSGKNECRINGRICATSTLRQITATLVDIFGQSQHLNLLKVDNHIKVLDDYQRNDGNKQRLAELYAEYRSLNKSLSAFGGSDTERERLLDILKFQIKEIKDAHLSQEEENQLNEMRSRVVNVEKMAESIDGALQALSFSGSSAVFQLSQGKQSLFNAVRYDKKVSDLHERLQALKIELDDVTENLEDIREQLDYDPKAIDQMEDRLDKIKALKKKYGSDIEAILLFAQNAEKQYESLNNAADEIARLNTKLDAVITKMYSFACELSLQRQQTALSFKKEIESQLCDLGMAGTTFSVQFNDKPTIEEYKKSVSPNGYDKVEFLLSANKGEPLKPLAKIISGGEMSRFMLAIKNITAKIENIPTMVFDEIDIGISGTMAQMVAIKLANVSREYQCIVITHLPQIVAMGDSNLLITKHVVDNRTQSTVTLLDAEGKIDEVARLSGGKDIGEYSKLHGKELVDWADKIKQNL